MPNVFVRDETYRRLKEIKGQTGRSMSEVIGLCIANSQQSNSIQTVVDAFRDVSGRVPEELRDMWKATMKEYLEKRRKAL